MPRDEKLIDQLVSAIYRKFRDPKNQAKGESWKQMSDAEILLRLAEEKNELVESVDQGDFANAIDEAADIAIFAAFYADKEREL